MANTESQPGIILPDINGDTAFWWNALGNQELYIQHCPSCARSWLAPVKHCPYCAHPKWEWKKSSGMGTVYSWVVYHRAFDPAFAGDVPYTILTVKLEEGAKIFGRLLPEGETKQPQPDQKVQAAFYSHADHTFVGFKLIS